ncbi:hypothetical protein B0T24DRAFT_617274 [Lasiosphaeria ovina]|uniref:Uncharacterized protein n=1 Tax=Lasiosphaeria ovina TaxID=92902 RepID=A0AAE0KFR8_9PEZI|nr:hypothetical protein B0T24DRAFT_617274 [Lasiosphaeria ovina]
MTPFSHRLRCVVGTLACSFGSGPTLTARSVPGTGPDTRDPCRVNGESPNPAAASYHPYRRVVSVRRRAKGLSPARIGTDKGQHWPTSPSLLSWNRAT